MRSQVRKCQSCMRDLPAPSIPPARPQTLPCACVQVNVCVCVGVFESTSVCPAGRPTGGEKVTDRWIKARSQGHGIHHAPFTLIPSSPLAPSFLYIEWSLAHLLASPLPPHLHPAPHFQLILPCPRRGSPRKFTGEPAPFYSSFWRINSTRSHTSSQSTPLLAVILLPL